MKHKLLGENIEPKCAYCKIGKTTPDNNNVLCPKKGVMSPDFRCKKFKYDPLKREPNKKIKLDMFSPEDFAL